MEPAPKEFNNIVDAYKKEWKDNKNNVDRKEGALANGQVLRNIISDVDNVSHIDLYKFCISKDVSINPEGNWFYDINAKTNTRKPKYTHSEFLKYRKQDPKVFFENQQLNLQAAPKAQIDAITQHFSKLEEVPQKLMTMLVPVTLETNTFLVFSNEHVKGKNYEILHNISLESSNKAGGYQSLILSFDENCGAQGGSTKGSADFKLEMLRREMKARDMDFKWAWFNDEPANLIIPLEKGNELKAPNILAEIAQKPFIESLFNELLKGPVTLDSWGVGALQLDPKRRVSLSLEVKGTTMHLTISNTHYANAIIQAIVERWPRAEIKLEKDPTSPPKAVIVINNVSLKK